jgi:2-oxoglutarate ferredoxin oxidoreductase subunit beta
LTKGQDSATADKGSKTKKGNPVALESIDLCEMAIQGGAGFVARGFSGDRKQVVEMLKAAFSHTGLSFLDIISPCVIFNNVPTSTKSYAWVREHMEATHTFDFIPYCEEIVRDFSNGSTTPIVLHDGSTLKLCKLRETSDITRKSTAISEIEKAKEDNQILTGILYLDPESKDTHEILETSATPLNTMGETELCPGNKALQGINDSFR